MGEFIKAPENSHFIRGIQRWSRGEGFGLRRGEISVSLHRDGHTIPLRDYGYVLAIEEAGIVAAYPGDVTSQVISGRKVLTGPSLARKWTDLKDDLEALIQATPVGKHNELFVDALRAEIVGVYAFGSGPSAGRRAFLDAGRQQDLPLHTFQ